MRHQILRRFSCVALCLASSAAFALDVPTGNPDLKLNLSVVLQARAALSWDGDKTMAASLNGTVDTDYYIRRAGLIASGIAYNKFTYYIYLDTPNFGVRGNYSGSTFVQDMHVGYVLATDVEVEAGFLYMPLSHLALNSSSATSAIEKSTAILFFNNSRGQRETGVQMRALFFDRRILLRGGAYEGLHGDRTDNLVVNPNGRPLAAGMLRLNLVGWESDYYNRSLYLDGKSRISIGVGGQFQTKGSNTPVTSVDPITGTRSTRNTAVNDYLALAADLFADIALPADTELALQADIYRFDWGSGSDKTGFGTTLELGYRWGPLEPEINGYWFNSDARQNNLLKLAGGLNYLLKGHQAKISAEFWNIKSGQNLAAVSAVHQFVLQFQASF
jgi:hypothetical protein